MSLLCSNDPIFWFVLASQEEIHKWSSCKSKGDGYLSDPSLWEIGSGVHKKRENAKRSLSCRSDSCCQEQKGTISNEGSSDWAIPQLPVQCKIELNELRIHYFAAMGNITCLKVKETVSLYVVHLLLSSLLLFLSALWFLSIGRDWKITASCNRNSIPNLVWSSKFSFISRMYHFMTELSSLHIMDICYCLNLGTGD